MRVGRVRDGRFCRGFTLIEIMVVIVILGIMAAAVVVNVGDKPDGARVNRAKADIDQIETALDMYRMDHSRYPDELDSLEPRYLKRLMHDPWDNPYGYRQPGEHGETDVFSLGADGEPGGDGVDADIGNWQRR